MLAYKPNLNEVLDRLRSLYERRTQDRIFATFSAPSSALEEFGKQYPGVFCDYPDPVERIQFWEKYYRERAKIEDDSIPSAYLSEMDQGLYGGLLGRDAQFMSHPETGWISSMVKPVISDWSEFDSLVFDENHPWYNRYISQLEIFVNGAKQNFGISHFIMIDGLNFVFELLGATATYMSLIDNPEMVHRAINFAFDLNVKVQRTFFEYTSLLMEGTCSNMVQWIPGRIVSESVDPFHMTNVDYFEKWGREPIERILDEFDGGVLHIHGNGRHLLEHVCTIKGLKAVFMGDDTGFPLAFDIADELKRRADDMPLVLLAGYEDFTVKLKDHTLPGGILYHVEGASSVEDINRIMEDVHEYRV